MLDAQRENWWHAHEILGGARNASPAWSSDALGKLFPKFFSARALIFLTTMPEGDANADLERMQVLLRRLEIPLLQFATRITGDRDRARELL
jgi:hypothetical protein